MHLYFLQLRFVLLEDEMEHLKALRHHREKVRSTESSIHLLRRGVRGGVFIHLDHRGDEKCEEQHAKEQMDEEERRIAEFEKIFARKDECGEQYEEPYE